MKNLGRTSVLRSGNLNSEQRIIAELTAFASCLHAALLATPGCAATCCRLLLGHRHLARCVAGLLIFFFAGSLARSQEIEKSKQRSGNTVMVISLKDQIDKALMYVLRRGFQTARDDQDIAAIVIDMDTPGGELRITEDIISWLRALSAENIRIYSFVNVHAQSAGAIICLATDAIYMAPGSRIGSAAPILIDPTGGGIQVLPDDVKEKILSDTRALVRGVAHEKGYLPELAEAMVDNQVEVKVGERIVCKQGQLLNLTAEEAIEVIPPMTKPILATAIVENIDELLEAEGLSTAGLVRIEPLGAEKVARWITILAPILMMLAFVGIYTEFKTPGFGIPGIVGVCCLILFLFGHYIAGLAGKEDVALILVGIALLAVEIFVLPGFGVCGALGIVALMAGVMMAMIPQMPSVPDLPGVEIKPLNIEPFLTRALLNLLITSLLTVVSAFFLAKWLPKTSVFNALILHGSTRAEDGYIGTDNEGKKNLIGKTGVALTTLRPSGIAVIENERLDVVSDGEYIDKDEPVTVRRVEGVRIIVARA